MIRSIFCALFLLVFVNTAFALSELPEQASADGSLVYSFRKQPVPVPIMNANMGHYARFLKEMGGDPLAVDSFVSKHSNRVVVDMILLQQALHLGGADVQLQFYGRPNPARAELDVKQGLSPLLGYETWLSNFDETVYVSDVVIPKGDFLKVVVGRQDNGNGLMKVDNLKDLRKLTVVTGLHWGVDRRTLRDIGVKKIITAPKYLLQISMLQEGRADFGLYEYTNIIKEMPVDLKIVPGITIGLNDSRHFMISKTHPEGKKLFEALQRGVAILKSRGTFKKAYNECGFMSGELESWHRIFPEIAP